MNRKGIAVGAIAAIGIFAVFYFAVYPRLSIVTGYNAKILCSCLFVSGLDQEYAEANDLGFSLLWLAHNRVDYKKKRVRSSVLGMQGKEAVYRPGYGCTLLSGVSPESLPAVDVRAGTHYAPGRWPAELMEGNPALRRALGSAFDTTDSPVVNSRAVVVIKDGQLAGEAYAEGFDRHTPLLGWSMTKSLTAALIGIRTREGAISLDDPLPVTDWEADARGAITWARALQMETGLYWEEDYANVSPATTMLYEQPDMGKYAASQPLEFEPGTLWQYSSGTSNILSRALRAGFSTDEDYLQFPYKALFGPLGAESFVLETDASGHFVGSSYAYATARDWAKLGQLFLDGGRVGDRVVLDTAFVDFCRSPNTHSDGAYGGHFWLNAHGAHRGYAASDYWMNGFQGQRVSIHPQENTVIVRLGVTHDSQAFDFDAWTLRVLDALEAEAVR